jgi:outer membrane lipoprotein SlyB
MRIASLLAAALLAVAGCAAQQPSQPPVSSTEGSTLVQTGQVTNVRDVTTAGGRTSGVGSLVGGVLGGLAGSHIGGGYGRTAAVVGGGLAGGVAGHEMQKAGATRKVTEVSVRFANGEVRTYQVEPGESFRIGDTVTVMTNNGVTRIGH